MADSAQDRSVSTERGAGSRARKGAKKPLSGEEETALLSKRAVELSRFYGGKLEVVPQVPIRGLEDFSYLYTPGVAQVSRDIARDADLSFELTGRWNTIGIVTDGSRVLGLGNIGPEASLPVMEGKALLFKYLGGVNAYPIPIRVKSGEQIVETVQRLEPALGGVNLEDIASPKCFQVLETLQATLNIPVWHDDQLGTAAASVAGFINAVQVTGRSIARTRIVMLGAGAANIATARLLKALGVDMGALTMVDSHGILHSGRDDMDEMMLHNRWKYDIALNTNEAGLKGGLDVAMKGADVLIAASTPVPDTVKPAWVTSMAPKPIVFALANPVPEIWPQVAREAGAAVVATGRSDFPNQLNNSLIFPPVFRGILDARARGMPDEVVLVAARELAKGAQDKGLTSEHLVPTMEEAEVFPRMAAAVAVKAQELGIARVRRTRAEYEEHAKQMMARPHQLAKVLIESGLIAIAKGN